MMHNSRKGVKSNIPRSSKEANAQDRRRRSEDPPFQTQEFNKLSPNMTGNLRSQRSRTQRFEDTFEIVADSKIRRIANNIRTAGGWDLSFRPGRTNLHHQAVEESFRPGRSIRPALRI
eukprot:758814-Hanusia_phi.AAC.3